MNGGATGEQATYHLYANLYFCIFTISVTTPMGPDRIAASYGRRCALNIFDAISVLPPPIRLREKKNILNRVLVSHISHKAIKFELNSDRISHSVLMLLFRHFLWQQ